MFEKLENIYLDYLRYALLLFATLALIFTLFNLVFASIKISESPDLKEVKGPSWSELRYEILGIKSSSNDKKQVVQSKNKPEAIEGSETLDEQYLELLNLMLSIFGSEGMIKSAEFEEFFSPSFYSNYLSDISIIQRTNFKEDLTVFIQDLIQDQRVVRLGDQDLKINLLKDALVVYKSNFLKEQYKIETANDYILREALANNEEGSSQILFSFYSLGAFVLILMYLLILKVEKNLRDIPKAVESIK